MTQEKANKMILDNWSKEELAKRWVEEHKKYNDLKETNEDLQEMLLKKDDEIDIYIEKIREARRFIEENSVKFGKYKVLIQEDDELAEILSEVVRI